MTHLAADSISRWLSTQAGTNPISFVMDADAANRVRAGLGEDAKGLLYSATLSFLSALEAMQGAHFSWAIVKLYYSAFYAARSILASNGTCIFYQGSKPYSMTVTPGSQANREQGVTHKVVWSLFAKEFPNNILLNEISGTISHKWMANLREEANYRNAKFPDPIVPSIFSIVDSVGISEAIQSYCNDSTYLLTFDKDHAAVAFPFECIRQARKSLAREGIYYESDEIECIVRYSDRIGIDYSVFC